jgi:hypothetical protein
VVKVAKAAARCPVVWKGEVTAAASTVEAREAGSGAKAANSNRLLSR